MSTTTAPASEPAPEPAHFGRYARAVWRIVEAQHRISTNRLAATLADQAVLEALVEEVKPPLPPAARGLHYLLATPFRYGHKSASRFRAAGERPGIFYAAEHVRTVVAEIAYWRLRFLSRSPGLAWPTSTIEHTAFTIDIAATRTLDLTAPPFAARTDLWTRADDYGPCQRFAATARRIDAQLIRYTSVRDGEAGANLALLDPAAFASPAPRLEQTWHMRLDAGRLTMLAAAPAREAFAFGPADFGLE